MSAVPVHSFERPFNAPAMVVTHCAEVSKTAREATTSSVIECSAAAEPTTPCVTRARRAGEAHAIPVVGPRRDGEAPATAVVGSRAAGEATTRDVIASRGDFPGHAGPRLQTRPGNRSIVQLCHREPNTRLRS